MRDRQTDKQTNSHDGFPGMSPQRWQQRMSLPVRTSSNGSKRRHGVNEHCDEYNVKSVIIV
jgi:hypothetical protein